MKIGVISDTHLAGRGSGIPNQVFKAFETVDLILHCGDLECIGVLDELQQLAPVKAVRGYEDPMESGTRLMDRSRVIDIANIDGRSSRIAMVHDIQWPYPPVYTTPDGKGIILPENTEVLLKKKFGCLVDVVLFGDTHEELILWENGVLWMNPGSPTFPGTNHMSNSLGTVGILDINRSEIVPCIIDLESQ